MEFHSPGPICYLGHIPICLYSACIVLGFLAAAYAAAILLKRCGYDFHIAALGSMSGFLGGLIGGRIYFVLLCWQDYVLHPEQVFTMWSHGRSIHGGIIGSIMAGAMFCRAMRFPFLLYCDLAGVGLSLGQAIGRWGNFFNSEAFGLPVGPSFPLRLYIPIGQRPAIYRHESFFHPTFLYESLWDLAIFLFLYFFAFKKLRPYPGTCFLAYVILYSLGRLVIESLRTDSVMSWGCRLPALPAVSALLGH